MARNAAIGATAAGVPVYTQALPLIAAELHRSQRYEHPLSVLVLSPDDRADVSGNGRLSQLAARSSESIYNAFFVLGSLVLDSLRESDIVAYAPKDEAYVAILSESDHVAARHAARRFSEAFYKRTSRRLRIGVSQFPADGFTIEDLVDQARRTWRERPLGNELLAAPPDDGSHG